MGEKHPFVTKEQLERAAATWPTPFHVYSEKLIRERARALEAAFSWNPGFKEYFAVKATPNPALISILREYGFGVDCSSECELMLAEAMGFAGEDIMFSSNDTPAREFAYAAELGAQVNLDDISHIDAWERAVGSFPAFMSLRFNPGGDFAFANGIFDTPGKAKFGLTEPQMLEASRELSRRGVRELGVHALLASNTVTNEYYPALARLLFELAVRIQRETGVRVSLVNLSGGVGVAYRPEEEPNDIRAIGEGVRRAFEEVLVPAGMGGVRIACELGRFMLAPFGALVCRVTHHKHIYRDYLGVDACAANLMRPMLYDAYHHITVMGKEDAPATHKYDVVGMLCENSDRLATGRLLPEVEEGDLLFIHDTGAHGHSMGYNYNGRLRSAEVLLREDGSTRLIRRAETPADYFATLDVLPIAERLEELGARRGSPGVKRKTARP
ncbi:MAG: diaminopimelate decarboxylase [Olsenella sp.]|nr:diaminopimelate decarboxylase [Olsenella sp.]